MGKYLDGCVPCNHQYDNVKENLLILWSSSPAINFRRPVLGLEDTNAEAGCQLHSVNYGRIISFGKDVAEAPSAKIERIDLQFIYSFLPYLLVASETDGAKDCQENVGIGAARIVEVAKDNESWNRCLAKVSATAAMYRVPILQLREKDVVPVIGN